MPIIKSAKKKLKQDKKRKLVNSKYKDAYEKAIKKLAKTKGDKKTLLKEVYSKVDKAWKKKIISKKKASRLKSRVSKLLSK